MQLARIIFIFGFFGLEVAFAVPNIVLMISDDQGWDGLSVQMHPEMTDSKSDFYLTPRLEELADQGMRFSAAYSPSTVCSPTRASLQTGMSPAKNHWTKAAPIYTAAHNFPLVPVQHRKELFEEEVTIGEVLQSAGYKTAHYGKWHLQGGGPAKHGYDESDGETSNRDALPLNNPDNPLDVIGMSERALNFMQRANEEGRPFFVQISYYPLHEQQNASPETITRVKQRSVGRIHHDVLVAAVTEDLDTGVGVIMDGVEQLGLGDNTYVIYMGDNGQRSYEHTNVCEVGSDCRLRESNAALLGAKGNLSEGGIRVPFIIKGPGIEEDSWSHARMVGYDLFPTFAEWAGIDKKNLPEGIEGGSFAGILKNNGAGQIERPRPELVFHFPHYQDGAPQSAVYLDEYKLIKFYEINKTALFNIFLDIGERENLAMRIPEKAKELEVLLDEYLVFIDADIPAVNLNYNSSKPRAIRANGMGGKVIYNPSMEVNNIYYPNAQ